MEIVPEQSGEDGRGECVKVRAAQRERRLTIMASRHAKGDAAS